MLENLLTGILMASVAISMIGCQSAIGQDQNTVVQTIEVGELNRIYYLHVPSELPKDKAVALVIMFHGGGGTTAFAARESKFSELADREGFLVAYPEGIGRRWHDGRGVNAIPAQRDNVDDLAFVSALIDDVSKKHRVDAKSIYATGISNGAIFSYYLAANLSSRIAAIAPVAGGISEAQSRIFKPEGHVSVLVFHGTDDPLVPYNGGYITAFGSTRGTMRRSASGSTTTNASMTLSRKTFPIQILRMAAT